MGLAPATAVPAAQAGEHSGAPTPAVAPESAGLQRKPALQERWLADFQSSRGGGK